MLAAFVREYDPKSNVDDDGRLLALTTDVQAALTVIGRREVARDTHAPGLLRIRTPLAGLFRANLDGADLRSAQLLYADLRSAKLRNANAVNVNVTDAILTDADLRGADLRGVRGVTEDEIRTVAQVDTTTKF